MTTMTNSREALSDLFKECWKNEDMRERFQGDPTSVLAEFGLSVPEEIDIEVIENTENTVNLTMPKAPANYATLSDEEILEAATGSHNFKAIEEVVR